MESVNLKNIYQEIELLKKAVAEIKLTIVNQDMSISRNDIAAIECYKKEKLNGKLMSHEKIKKNLGL